MSAQNSPQKDGDTMAREVQVLSVSPGICEGKPVCVLTIRPNSGWTPENLQISKEQFLRLRHDLNYLAAASDCLKDDGPPPAPDACIPMIPPAEPQKPKPRRGKRS